MIVRLKGPYRVGGGWDDFSFQFYDSPIKSPRIWNVRIGADGFQFYDSPIKSFLYVAALILLFRSFQFYDSPIKSRSKRQKTLLILNNLSFNYINKLTNKVVEAQR